MLLMQCFWVVYHGISHESLVFSWYTHDPKGSCVYQENYKWLVVYSMVYHKKGLHKYFIPCHRKYSGQQGQHNKGSNNTWKKLVRISMYDGKVGRDSVELHWSVGRFGGILTSRKSFPAFWLAVFSMPWCKVRYLENLKWLSNTI